MYDVTLNIMSHPGQILPIYTHQSDYLSTTHGIDMKLLESPDPTSYQDALKDLRSGGGRYDMVMYFPRYNGDLVSAGYLKPMDDLIKKHDAGALFDNISDAYRKLYCEWGGQTIAVPVDGDVAMMYFRKDAFGSEEAKAKYKEKHGKALEVPRTWDDFKQIAEFFTGWDWAGSGKEGFGFQTSTWAVLLLSSNGRPSWHRQEVTGLLMTETRPPITMPVFALLKICVPCWHLRLQGRPRSPGAKPWKPCLLMMWRWCCGLWISVGWAGQRIHGSHHPVGRRKCRSSVMQSGRDTK